MLLVPVNDVLECTLLASLNERVALCLHLVSCVWIREIKAHHISSHCEAVSTARKIRLVERRRGVLEELERLILLLLRELGVDLAAVNQERNLVACGIFLYGIVSGGAGEREGKDLTSRSSI